jgi:pSer/pThr/pTyr-binding forkhead associated (FHA) protein
MRASDDTRERTLDQLGRGFAEGYLSPDTYELRAGLAIASRHAHDLDQLVDDLPRPGGLRAALVTAWRGLIGRPAAEVEPDPTVVPEPPRDAASDGLVIGRDPDCALVVTDPTVSRRHAELRREGDRWVVADLGSSNGTRVNGWRIRRATVGLGDELMLGRHRMVLGAAGPPSWHTAPERPRAAG